MKLNRINLFGIFHRLFPHPNDLDQQQVQLWVHIGLIQDKISKIKKTDHHEIDFIIANRLSPSYLIQKHRAFNSFDLGSADELGMPDSGSPLIKNMVFTVPPVKKVSPLVKSSAPSDLDDRRTTTNGLFLCSYFTTNRPKPFFDSFDG